MSIKNICFSALGFVIFYNLILFHTEFGIGTSILFFGLNVFFFIVRNKENKNLNLAILGSSLSILFSFLFAYRSNGIVQTANLFLAGFFSFSALYFYKFSGVFSFKIPDFLFIPFVTTENFIKGLFSIFKPDNSISSEFRKSPTASLMKGLLIAAPVFFVLLILLTEADPIFGKLTQNLFSSAGERIVVSLIIFLIMLGFGLIRILHKASTEEQERFVSPGKSHELSIICTSIAGLFAIFIFVQFRYLFFGVSETELGSLGIKSLTYSEYVRRGFFELLIVSVISSAIVIYVLKYLHLLKYKQKQLIQILASILTIETGLLLLSAVKRIFLYADAHGLTRARIFGFVFLIFLGLILIIFLIKIFKNIKKEYFFAYVINAAVLGVLTISVLNVDGIIATKYKPTVNGEVDYFYIATLSTDAVSSWEEIISHSEKLALELEKSESVSADDNRKKYWATRSLMYLSDSAKIIIDKYATLNEIKAWHANEQGGSLRFIDSEQDFPKEVKLQRKWQALNISEYSAYRMLSGNLKYYTRIQSALNRLSALETKVTDEVRNNTKYDRATNPPLTN